MRKSILLLLVLFLFSIPALAQEVTQGSLFAIDKDGKHLGASALKHTSVDVKIEGFIAKVTVRQEFQNSFTVPIEALYTFPLSQNSAVNEMTMLIGERVIRGRIKRQEEAKAIYENAKKEGKTAALLDQQRPNVFRQSIANVLPDDKIVVEISYIETIPFRNGNYEFVFPMVVGPRYNPQSKSRTKSVKTDSIVSRSGHDISIKIDLDAGIPIEKIASKLHEISVKKLSSSSAEIALNESDSIPNRDFILSYDVTGNRIENSILTESYGEGGFFLMHLTPPEDFSVEDLRPKEVVFVLDTSGSMSGFPIENAKEAMLKSIEGLYPNDSFNLITFAGDTEVLFASPVKASAKNVQLAKSFLNSRSGAGGTEMMEAVRQAFAGSGSQSHIRIVCFMTDGFIGNESEILAEIKKNPNARVFAFGIGNSVNRYLLDNMAKEGRGEAEYVTIRDAGSEAATRFHRRIRNPLLTDISIDWKGLSVRDVYPRKSQDLFDAKPVVVFGRYLKPEFGTITLTGTAGNQRLDQTIDVAFANDKPGEKILGTMWARTRIAELNSQRLTAEKESAAKLVEEITNLGLEFNLMTEFTSFVAVEEEIRNVDGKSVTVEVPLELADGTFGAQPWDGTEQRIPGLSTANTLGLIQSTKGKRSSRALEMRNSPPQILDVEITKNQQPSNSQKFSASATGGMLVNISRIVNDHYKNLRSLTASYSVTKYDNALNTEETNHGKLAYIRDSDENPWIRMDAESPKETFVVANEKYVLYRRSLNSAIVGKLDTSKTAELMDLLSLSKGSFLESYIVTYLGSEKIGEADAWHLQLAPKLDSNYKSIEIWFNGTGSLVQLKLVSKNDDSVTYRFSDIEENNVIDLRVFILDLEGVKIIDN